MPPDGGLLYGLGVADLRADPWLFCMPITIYERGYRDYVRYLRSFHNTLGSLRKGVWEWFWKGLGARITEMVIHICVILLVCAIGILLAATYIAPSAYCLMSNTLLKKGPGNRHAK